MTDQQQQYTDLYGAFQRGDYELGDRLCFGSGESSGTLIWSCRDHDGQALYVVDDGSGFPVELRRHEIVQALV